jgi:hypothetical protein
MKYIDMKKILIMFIMFTLFLFLGTFFHIDMIEANTYEGNDPWYGTNLDFSEINAQAITFESEYVPFSTITDDPLLVDDSKKYVIETAEDLYMFSVLNNGENYDIYRHLHYVLGNDIDYFDVVVTDSSKRFEPVGFRYPFAGVFDGQGFEITNLYLDSIYDSIIYEEKYLGLIYYAMFSHVSSEGVIKNLGLINPLIIQPIEWGAMQHVSPLVGLNEGHIHHVYYIDQRGHQAGFHAEGAFHISGLVSKNLGILEQAFVSSAHIKSLAVLENISDSAVVSENTGTMHQVYYDQSILLDPNTMTDHSVGLDTVDFQNSTNFDDAWFFNTDYEQLTEDLLLKEQYHLTHTYPILQGLNITSNELEISDALDLVYMQELLKSGNMLRSKTYKITHDIDMHQVSYDAYQTAAFGFNGVITSALRSELTSLYERDLSQGGNISYHSIIGLNIVHASYIGNAANYGFFSVLFGEISHLNFIDVTIDTLDINETYERDILNIGILSGQMVDGTIDDVHVDGNIFVRSAQENIGKLSLGMSVGRGSGHFHSVSTTGLIEVEPQAFQTKLDESTIGGMIGYAQDVEMNDIIDDTIKRPISYLSTYQGTTYIGGVVGSGYIGDMDRIISKGHIDLSSISFQNQLYIGGIFGKGTLRGDELSNMYHHGNIDVYVDQVLDVYVNGIGYVVSDEDPKDIKSVTNHGDIVLSSDINLSTQTLEQIEINGSFGFTFEGSASFYGLYQTKDQSLDMSLIDTFSGLLTHIGTDSIDVVKAYQKGNIIYNTMHEMTQEDIKISGVFLGSHMSITHVRQEGYIDINVNHDSQTPSQSILKVLGVFEEISDSKAISEIYQGGNISISKDPLVQVNYDINVSAVGLKHLNTSHYIEYDIDHRSIEITDQIGSMDTILNAGDIDISGDFNGNIKSSGIILENEGLITNSINLGNIDIFNNNALNQHKIEAAGIAYQMIGAYAQVKDTANQGDIKVVSNTGLGYAHASGIILRNDINDQDVYVSPSDEHQYQKLLFSINYGDIYAYNNSIEDAYTIVDETRAKASGLLTIGVMSTINNMNIGNIFSNHLASAMIGFLALNLYGTLGYDQVFISNQMNYGRVREITAYDPVNQLFTIDMNQNPSKAIDKVFGAVVGKIHTGTSTWVFAGDVTYPIDRIYFGYLLNFDEKINMFDQAPALSSSWADIFGGDTEAANDVILEMQKYMATTNTDDQSAAPFNTFYAGGWIGQYLGKQISSYDLTDTETGMFYEDFAFRNQRPTYKGTDQYILDYISYIPRDKMNDTMLDTIEMYRTESFMGIYALSSSKGIGNGIFIPDNFSLEGLHEYHSDYPLGNQAYLGDIDDQDSISYRLYRAMRQIKVDFATTIYDLEIKQIDALGEAVEGGVVLKDPEIDEKRSLITYYLPSNASILGDLEPTILNVESFVEVSPNVAGARKVLDLLGSGDPTYTWVGTHKKDGNQMVEIGPYKETGVYDLSSDLVFDSSTSRSTPMYNYSGDVYDTLGATSHVFSHNPHIYQFFLFFYYWYAEGYQVTPSAQMSPGYAPYEAYSEPNYPTLYRYVGPSTEAVTYVQSDPINGVSVYDPSDVRFIANTDEGSYQISESASFEHGGVSIIEPISIPRSYGVYDMMSYQGTYIDSVEDHYGKIRVYSNAYEVSDPSTYKDYDIRIIRTADEDITQVLNLEVNQVDALNPLDDINQLTASINLDGTNQNSLEITYETYNIADLYDMLQHVYVYNYDTQVKINTSYYRIEQGHVSTLTSFDNLTGSWGTGSFTIKLIPLEDFPSGNYVLKTSLLSGSSYDVYFTKDDSSEKSILSFTYNNQLIEPESDMYVSHIPYGIFYDALDEQTNIVNFTNLDAYQNVYYDQLETMIPDYLEALEISNFATIDHIDLSITQLVDGRYQYDVVYMIVAEDMSSSVFTHRLIETDIASYPKIVYKNGGESPSLTQVDVKYLEAPNIRVEYLLDDFYIPQMDNFSIEHAFSPSNLGETAEIDKDYFIQKIDGKGFEINFNQNTPKGSYTYQMTYQHEVFMWGENLSWNHTFDQIEILKLKNDQSKISDILFVSDTIFSGFNTIVDYEEIDGADYEGYINNPSTRRINVLPTTGIVYGSYDNYNAYYIIGQVQKTNLSTYEPIFYTSDHAIIRRVTDDINHHYDYQAEDLAYDFQVIGDTFNFVHYRVYAEDYDENPLNYTDYYVAVQDVTNNIRFEVTIDNQTSIDIDQLYFSIDICQLESGCTYEDSAYQMGAFAVYNSLTEQFEMTHFQTTMHGTYSIYVDLDKNFKYQIILEQSQIDGTSFYLEDSILPRKYYITIVITEEIYTEPWAYTHENTPQS